VPEGYLHVFVLSQLRLCGDTAFCVQRSSFVWQPVPYSPTSPRPHPNKTFGTTSRYFRQSVGVQSLAWWLVCKFRTDLTCVGLCTLQDMRCWAQSVLIFLFLDFPHVFCVVSANSVELSGVISAYYFDVKWRSFVLVFVLLAAKRWVMFIAILILWYHISLLFIQFFGFLIHRYFSEILLLPSPPSPPCFKLGDFCVAYCILLKCMEAWRFQVKTLLNSTRQNYCPVHRLL
jgi:hypothetical protein